MTTLRRHHQLIICVCALLLLLLQGVDAISSGDSAEEHAARRRSDHVQGYIMLGVLGLDGLLFLLMAGMSMMVCFDRYPRFGDI